MASILALNGPNLNLLGTREPSIYGHETLKDINRALKALATDNKHQFETFQTNHEGQLVDRIHQAKQSSVDFIIINPAAFTHTSIALRDALIATSIPFIEVHLSNIYARERFRQHSYLSDIAQGVLCGFGAYGYQLALSAALNFLTPEKN